MGAHGLKLKGSGKPATCPVCERRMLLTAHHLVPYGAGGANAQENIVRLCGACHEAAHARFGPGDDYCGPANRMDFVLVMRGLYDDTRIRRALRWLVAGG